MAHGLSCSEACGIFPDQGLNPRLLHWQAGSFPLSYQGSLCSSVLSLIVCICSSQPQTGFKQQGDMVRCVFSKGRLGRRVNTNWSGAGEDVGAAKRCERWWLCALGWLWKGQRKMSDLRGLENGWVGFGDALCVKGEGEGVKEGGWLSNWVAVGGRKPWGCSMWGEVMPGHETSSTSSKLSAG